VNWLWFAITLGPFQQGKQWLQDTINIDKQSLHIIIGFLIFAVLLWARKGRPWLAWIVVLLVAILGEVLDIYELVVIREWSWDAIYWPWHSEDIVATALGPLILSVAIRLWQRRHESTSSPSEHGS